MSDDDGTVLPSPAFEAAEFGLGLSYDDYAVMGLVSGAFSDLDLTWSFLVWSLLAKCDVITMHCDDAGTKHQATGAAVTASLAFRRKLDLSVALAVEQFGGDDKRVQTIQDVAKLCAPLEDQRNTMIHSWWSPTGTPQDGVDLARTARTKHGLDRKKGLTISTDQGIDRAALLALAQRMKDLVDRLHEIRMAMYSSDPGQPVSRMRTAHGDTRQHRKRRPTKQ